MRKSSIRSKLLWGLLPLLALAFLLAPAPAFAVSPQARQIQINASAYQFEPGVIYANHGDHVTIELTSLDVVHGLYIDGYDLDVVVEPGQTARLSFTADRSGSFRLRCSITCGAMHPFMVGKLQVGTNWLLWKSIALAGVSMLAGILLMRRGMHG